MATAEIITIGTELLLGQLVDTNTAAIAEALAGVGVDVFRETSVGDNEGRIADAVRQALERADAVICAGGLGPTVDDLTREAVAAATGRTLAMDEGALADLSAWFASVGRRMSPNNARQAMFPAGAHILENPKGTAPGFWLDLDDKVIVVMPGPPREMRPMLHDHVVPLLRERFDLHSVIATRVLRTVGISESELDSRIADLFRTSVNPSIAVLAHINSVDVKLTAKAATREAAHAMIDQLEPEIRRHLGDHIFSSDGASLEEVVGRQLRARDWTLATAESCTGGLVGELLTSIPGSSDYYLGGVVSYADAAKTELLGVPAELLAEHGAVSEETARAMAAGVRSRMRATFGVSVTGIAGPEGGSPAKPVGLVFVALADHRDGVEVKRLRIPGDREAIRHRAAIAALAMVWRATITPDARSFDPASVQTRPQPIAQKET
ncbi:MAG: competence/damage-inducible protein A [Candidatus Eremiobacteraeota bacterium]|nr:competence/damage-inducible protein A [Candidatus Eremiobacteraeota bacterium]